MPFVPGEDVIQVEMRYLWDSKPVENVLYFQALTSLETVDVLAFCADIYANWDSYVKSGLPANLLIREIYVTDLTTNTSPTWSYAISPPTAGTSVSPSLPNNVTIAYAFNTAGRGRSSRGRNYLLGLCEANVVANGVDPAWIGLWDDFYNDLPVIAAANNLRWVVFSRKLNGAFRTEGLAQAITSWGVKDTRVDTQRGRLS